MSDHDNDSFGHTTLHAGTDARVRCSTYRDGHLPSLSVDIPRMGITVYLAGEVITADHVRFAASLVQAAQKMAAECERLHAIGQAGPGAAGDHAA